MNKLQYEIIKFLIDGLLNQDRYADKFISGIFMTKSKDGKRILVSIGFTSKKTHTLCKRAEYIIDVEEYNFSKAKELKRLMLDIHNRINSCN